MLMVVSDSLVEASNSGSVFTVCDNRCVNVCFILLQECVLRVSFPFEATDRKHLSKQDRELLLQSTGGI